MKLKPHYRWNQSIHAWILIDLGMSFDTGFPNYLLSKAYWG